MTTGVWRIWKRVTVGAGLMVAAAYLVACMAPESLVIDRKRHSELIDAKATDIDAILDPHRIIVLGSSPGLMGISATQIEDALGRPALNASVLAARPMFPWYLREMLQHVHPGDIVVLADPRLSDMQRVAPPDDCRDDFAIRCLRPHLVALPDLKKLARFAAGWQEWDAKMRLLRSGPHGDLVFSQRANGASPAEAIPFDPAFADTVLAVALKTRAAVAARGACAVVAAAPFLIRADQRDRWDAEYRRLLQLAEQAPGGPILMPRAPPFVTDPGLLSSFGNYHPSERGRAWWTASMIDVLRGIDPSACAAARPAG